MKHTITICTAGTKNHGGNRNRGYREPGIWNGQPGSIQRGISHREYETGIWGTGNMGHYPPPPPPHLS